MQLLSVSAPKPGFQGFRPRASVHFGQQPNDDCGQEGASKPTAGQIVSHLLSAVLPHQPEWLLPVQDEASFEKAVLQASYQQPVVAYFFEKWAGVCRIFKPHVEKMARAEEFDQRLRFVSVNLDTAPFLGHQQGVFGIPALLVYRDGRIVQRMTGYHPEDKVKAFLQKALAAEAEPEAGSGSNS